MEAFEDVYEDLTRSAGTPSAEDTRRLYEALDSHGIPLVDNQIGQALTSLLSNRHVLALSVEGDFIHRLCRPALDFLAVNGDPALQAQALQCRAYWAQYQDWFIDWANGVYFFHLAERALQNITGYKRAMSMFPAVQPIELETGETYDLVAYLAYICAREMLKPQGFMARYVGKRKRKK